jgi:hypothetical protein
MGEAKEDNEGTIGDWSQRMSFPGSWAKVEKDMEYMNIIFNDIFRNIYGNLEKPENLAALHQVLLRGVFPSIQTRPYHRTDYDVFQQCRLMIQYLHPFRLALLDGQHRAAAVVCHSTGLSPSPGNHSLRRKWQHVNTDEIPPLNFGKLGKIAPIKLHAANLTTWTGFQVLRDISTKIQEEAAAAVARSLLDG